MFTLTCISDDFFRDHYRRVWKGREGRVWKKKEEVSGRNRGHWEKGLWGAYFPLKYKTLLIFSFCFIPKNLLL